MQPHGWHVDISTLSLRLLSVSGSLIITSTLHEERTKNLLRKIVSPHRAARYSLSATVSRYLSTLHWILFSIQATLRVCPLFFFFFFSSFPSPFPSARLFSVFMWIDRSSFKSRPMLKCREGVDREIVITQKPLFPYQGHHHRQHVLNIQRRKIGGWLSYHEAMDRAYLCNR